MIATAVFGSAALAVQAAGFTEEAQGPDKSVLNSVYENNGSDFSGVVVVDLPTVQGTTNDHVSVVKADSGENEQRSGGKELVIGSAEYDRKNERRMELIQKKVRGALTAGEEAEFEQLQTEILQITKRIFPHPPTDSATWQRLKEGAREKPDTPD